MKYPQQWDIINDDKWVLCSSSSLLQKQTADVITLCFKWHEKRRVRRSPAACSCFIVQKQVSFVLSACWVFYLLLLLGSVQMRPRWEMKRSFPGHQKRKMKAVSWCEKRLRTPQLVVLGICVLLLLPVVLFIAFFCPQSLSSPPPPPLRGTSVTACSHQTVHDRNINCFSLQ